MLVKVLAVEGNRIRLSRKAILKEQRAKMGGGEAPADGGGDGAPAPALTIEGGGDFPDDEPNFNRDAVAGVASSGGGDRPSGERPDRGGDRGRGGRGGRPGGGGRGRGRGPGGGGGRGGHGGGHGGPRH